MEMLPYGWLSNCALAPLVAALSVWILIILNGYRSDWRNVDIFMVVVVIQEILSSASVFFYSVINIIRSRNESSCNAVLWCMITLRIFQLSTITSLAIDRALILKWPYKYRFSVRQNQIMYHIIVLAVTSSLVGVAGVFARIPSSDFRTPFLSSPSSTPSPSLLLNTTTALPLSMSSSTTSSTTTPATTLSTASLPSSFLASNQQYMCTLNPLSWDIRFNLFFTCLCALLTLITLLAFVYIECNRSSDHRSSIKSRMMPNSRISSYGDLAVDSLGSTEAITKHGQQSVGSISNGAANHSVNSSLQRFHSFSNSKEDGGFIGGGSRHTILSHLRASDLRWPVIVAITSLCYAINQGPSLIFMFVGMIVPHFWTSLHDNVITWFALVESFLLPFSLYLTDDSFREAIKSAFSRRSAYGHDSGCKSIYKTAPAMMQAKSSGFIFPYNDFVMIDKPYMGLNKSSEPKRCLSSLNILSNGRLHRQESTSRPNCKLIDMMAAANDGSMNRYKSGHYVSPKKAMLTRNNSQLSYITCHSKTPFTMNSGSEQHISALMSNLCPEDSIRKSKMAWANNGADNNWRLSSTAEKNLNMLLDCHYPTAGGNLANYLLKANQQQNHDSQDEHIYATLKMRPENESSSDCGEKSAPKLRGDQTNSGHMKQSMAEKRLSDIMDDNSVSGVSFTTNANDDFEFHDTRSHGLPNASSGIKILNSNKLRTLAAGVSGTNDLESGESSYSEEETSMISSGSCSSSDSENDERHNKANNGGNQYRKHINSLAQIASPLRSKIRFPSNQAFFHDSNKRRGWQFFSTSDLHLLDSKSDVDNLHIPNSGLRPSITSVSPVSRIPMLNNSMIPTPNGIKGISYRRTMSETNLSPGQAMGNGCGITPRERVIYSPIRPMTASGAVPNGPNSHRFNYPTTESHHTNTSNSTNSSGFGESKFGGGMYFGDRKLSRISSFSKNRPRIRAQKYQIHRRAARREESIREMSNMDYRRRCVGSRFSLTHHDLNPKELAAFVSVKSMPDLTIGSYIPIYAPMKK